MKRLRYIHRLGIGSIAGLFLLFFTLNTTPIKANTAGVGISFEVFYQNLAPHGNWINDAEFGFVWSPNVGNDFRPYYSNGHWANTNYGNMWVSNFEWGWAPFHYGRWTLHNRYGWVWIPGYEWGPAWVSWREGGGYYGWAPLQPGVSINISMGSGYHAPTSYWTFVPYQNLYASNVYSYHSARRAPGLVQNTTIINNTYVDNSVTYVSGPSRSDVQRRTGTNVRTYEVNNTNVRSASTSRIDGNRIAVYRPDATTRSANSSSNIRSSNASGTTTTARRSASSTTPRSTRSAVNRNTATKNSTPTTAAARRSAAPTNSSTSSSRTTANTSSSTRTTSATPATRKATRNTPAAPARQSATTAPRATTTSSVRRTSPTPQRATNTRSSVRNTSSPSVRSTATQARTTRSTPTTTRRR